MNKEDLKKEFKGKFLGLRKIINSYDLIPHAPCDEFDALNHKILSNLYKGADFEKIKRVIDSKLISYYGLLPNEVEIEKLASEIIEWWNS